MVNGFNTHTEWGAFIKLCSKFINLAALVHYLANKLIFYLHSTMGFSDHVLEHVLGFVT